MPYLIYMKKTGTGSIPEDIRTVLVNNLVDDERYLGYVQLGSWHDVAPGQTPVDGNTVDWWSRTTGSTDLTNVGRGVQFNFNESVAVKYIKIYGYGIDFSVNIDRFNGSGWTTELSSSFDADYVDGNSLFEFNEAGAVSTSWRWIITATSGLVSNYYCSEVEMFDRLN